jgi:hypothetical protein
VFEGGLNSLGEPGMFANVLIYSGKKLWKPAACSNAWQLCKEIFSQEVGGCKQDRGGPLDGATNQ